MQPNQIKFKKPKESVEECILKNKTYSAKIYIPIQIRYKNTKVVERDIENKKYFY